MLARGSHLAALHGAHRGARPLDGRPGGRNDGGRHDTTDGTRVDGWHWKSVRTGPLEQIDDDHFGPPLAPPENPAVRYTAGYTQAPKTAGGYTMNWDKFDEGTVQPRWLPCPPAETERAPGRERESRYVWIAVVAANCHKTSIKYKRT